jgi:general secretion pathway protein G
VIAKQCWSIPLPRQAELSSIPHSPQRSMPRRKRWKRDHKERRFHRPKSAAAKLQFAPEIMEKIISQDDGLFMQRQRPTPALTARPHSARRGRMWDKMMAEIKMSCNSKQKSKGEAGFTLLELLVVIVILGLLIGLVAPAILRQLGNAKNKIAAQSIQLLAGDLDTYKLDVGSYPSTQEGLQALIAQPADVQTWSGPYLKASAQPLDPWGHPYLYQQPSSRPGLDYDLCSLGSADKPGAPGDPGLICNK